MATGNIGHSLGNLNFPLEAKVWQSDVSSFSCQRRGSLDGGRVKNTALQLNPYMLRSRSATWEL
jgi:hypothetical protein